MSVVISMLRGVNVGGHNKIKMAALRALYVSLKLRDPRTHVQSGNVIFKTEEQDLPLLATRIQQGIERTFRFRPEVILRTLAELRDAIAGNPFATCRGIDPSRLLVVFLASEPSQEIRDNILKIKTDPEELRMDRRHLYIYFPEGMARPKMSWPAIEKALKTPSTGRNWNSVTKLLALATELEASP